jgi:hypothetical protein
MRKLCIVLKVLNAMVLEKLYFTVLYIFFSYGSARKIIDMHFSTR